MTREIVSCSFKFGLSLEVTSVTTVGIESAFNLIAFCRFFVRNEDFHRENETTWFVRFNFDPCSTQKSRLLEHDVDR